jgi:hypothetical protein
MLDATELKKEGAGEGEGCGGMGTPQEKERTLHDVGERKGLQKVVASWARRRDSRKGARAPCLGGPGSSGGGARLGRLREGKCRDRVATVPCRAGLDCLWSSATQPLRREPGDGPCGTMSGSGQAGCVSGPVVSYRHTCALSHAFLTIAKG